MAFLDEVNLEPRALGRSGYPSELPWSEVLVIARHSGEHLARPAVDIADLGRRGDDGGAPSPVPPLSPDHLPRVRSDPPDYDRPDSPGS